MKLNKECEIKYSYIHNRCL